MLCRFGWLDSASKVLDCHARGSCLALSQPATATAAGLNASCLCHNPNAPFPPTLQQSSVMRVAMGENDSDPYEGQPGTAVTAAVTGESSGGVSVQGAACCVRLC